jgi:hypothetical protein
MRSLWTKASREPQDVASLGGAHSEPQDVAGLGPRRPRRANFKSPRRADFKSPRRPEVGEGKIDGWLIALVVAVMIALVLLALAEGTAVASSATASWADQIRAVDDAIAAGNVRAAARALASAYGAALRSGGWDGLLAVGDATLRLGTMSGARRAAEPDARRAYLTAMYRARQAGSLAGVLRTCTAFDTMGEAPLVVQCLGAAQQVARTPEEAARVASFSRRFDDPSMARIDGWQP